MPKSAIRRRKGRAGFTLVEVLAAVTIMAVALVSVIAMRNECVRDIRTVVDACDAWALGTLAMGAIETAEVLDEGTEGGTFDEYPAYRWDVEKRLIEVDLAPLYFPGMDRASISQKPRELLRIELVIRLADPPPEGPAELFRMVTYAPRRLPETGAP